MPLLSNRFSQCPTAERILQSINEESSKFDLPDEQLLKYDPETVYRSLKSIPNNINITRDNNHGSTSLS